MKTTVKSPKAASRLIQARRPGLPASIEDNRPESAAQAQLLAAVRSGEPSPLVSLVGQGRAGFSPAMIQKKGVAQLQGVVQRGGGETTVKLMIEWPFGTDGLDWLKELWDRKLANSFVGLKLTRALFSGGMITLEYSSGLDSDVVDKNIKMIADILDAIIKGLKPAGQLALEGGDLFHFEGDLHSFDLSWLEDIDLSLLRTTGRAPLALESGGENSPMAGGLSGHSSDKFPLFGSPDVSDRTLRLLSPAWKVMEELPESMREKRETMFQECLKLLKRLGVDSPVKEYDPLVKLNMSGGRIALTCPPSYRFLNEFAGYGLEANAGDKVKEKEAKKEETGEPMPESLYLTYRLKKEPSDEIVSVAYLLERSQDKDCLKFCSWVENKVKAVVLQIGDKIVIRNTRFTPWGLVEGYKESLKGGVLPQHQLADLVEKQPKIYLVGQGLVAVGTEADFPDGFFTDGINPCVGVAIRAAKNKIFALGHLDSDINGGDVAGKPFNREKIDSAISVLCGLMSEKNNSQELEDVEIILTRGAVWEPELYAIYHDCINKYFQKASIKREGAEAVYVGANESHILKTTPDSLAGHSKSVLKNRPDNVLTFIRNIYPQGIKTNGYDQASLDKLKACFQQFKDASKKSEIAQAIDDRKGIKLNDLKLSDDKLKEMKGEESPAGYEGFVKNEPLRAEHVKGELIKLRKEALTVYKEKGGLLRNKEVDLGNNGKEILTLEKELLEHREFVVKVLALNKKIQAPYLKIKSELAKIPEIIEGYSSEPLPDVVVALGNLIKEQQDQKQKTPIVTKRWNNIAPVLTEIMEMVKKIRGLDGKQRLKELRELAEKMMSEIVGLRKELVLIGDFIGKMVEEDKGK